jgi:hypothetical protein
MPSVVVAFCELWEKPVDPFDVSVLAGSGRRDPLSSQQVTPQEREKDQAMCHEINDKRSASRLPLLA